MKKHELATLILLALLQVQTVLASERWRIVVLQDPSAQSNTAMQEIHTVLSQRLGSMLTIADFDVISRQSLGLPDCVSENCAKLTDATIKNMANKSGKDVSLAVLYYINISDQSSKSVNRHRFTLNGRMVDLETEFQLDSFSTDGSFTELSNSCTDSCFAQWVVDNANILAQDLGSVLSEKLARIPRRTHYKMTINAFTPTEITRIDSYLKSLESYVTDTLHKDFGSQQQLIHTIADREITYVSTQSGSDLRNTIEQFVSQQGIPINVSYNESSRAVMLKRSSMPFLAGYISSLLTIILLSFITYFFMQQQKHQRLLSKLASGNQAQQWLKYFKTAHSPLVPRKKSWFEQEQFWLSKVKEAKNLSEQAWLLADQHQYDLAQSKIEQALSLNQDDADALKLKTSIVDYKRGFERLKLAESEIETHPSSALSILQEAKTLNPSLQEKITPLEQQCKHLIHQDLSENALTDAQLAINDGNLYRAYSIIDKTLSSISDDTTFKQAQFTLYQLRKQIDEQISPLNGNLEGGDMASGFHIYQQSSVSLARSTDSPSDTIVINYKRISRNGKQTLIMHQSGNYFIQDLGSSNGTMLDGVQQMSGQNDKIKPNSTIALGSGKAASSAGACQLDAFLPKDSPGTLILKLSKTALKFIDDTNMGQAWASLDEDIAKRWVMMNGKLAIGLCDNGELDIACLKGGKAVAYLYNNNGYAIEPAGHQASTELVINNHTMHAGVPLTNQASITIGKHQIRFKESV